MNPRLPGGSAGSGMRSATIVWSLPVILAAAILARCIVLSRKWLLFGDEFLTWYPVSAPFHSMLRSTTDTINTSPPFYFVTAWGWAGLFGNSALSLRLFTAFAAAAAVLVMFRVLRRAYGGLAAAGALAVAFVDPELLLQSGEARFYMLLLAEVAVGMLLYQRMMMLRRPPFALLAVNAVVHACMVMTHYFGPIFSGAILGAALLTCLCRRRSALWPASSIVAGWLVFLPWIPVFLLHLRMGKPTFWVTVPNFGDLVGFYGHYLTGGFWMLTFILCLIAAVALGAGSRASPVRRGRLLRLLAVRTRETPLLMLALVFSIVPLGIYLSSSRPGAASTFLDRYLLPCALGWAILCAHAFSRIFRLGYRGMRRGQLWTVPGAQAACVALFVGWSGWSVLDTAFKEKAQHLPSPLPAAVPLSEPVVVEYIHEFMALHFYSSESSRYYFALDPEAGLKAGGGGPANHQIMAALKRQFPSEFTEVVPYKEFLEDHRSFWIKIYNREWWRPRISQNPAFVSDAIIAEKRLVHVSRRQ
jgi:hypothetical protein